MKQKLSVVFTVALMAAHIASAVMVHGEASKVLRGEELIRALEGGGYTILLRHARTNRTAPAKEVPGTMSPLRMDQRNLTPDGERDVRLMFDVVRKYALPIGEVITSPSYRCRETADAFGKWTETTALRTFPVTPEAAALVGAQPKQGTNRVLVTHHFIIEGLVPGITPGDIGESEAAVIRATDDGKVMLVGKILLGDWAALAGGGSQSAPADAVTRTVVLSDPHDSDARDAVVIPNTRAGKLAAGYLAAFNSGDKEKMRAFTEASLEPNPDRPTDVRVQAYARLFEEHGPMKLTGIQSSTDDRIILAARSKRGDLAVTVTAAPRDAARAQSVTIGILGRGH